MAEIPPAANAPVVRVVGYLRGQLGLGYTGRSVVECLRAGGFPVQVVSHNDVGQPLLDGNPLSDTDDRADITIYCLNPNAVARAWQAGDVDPEDDAYRVCIPFFEPDRIPRSWLPVLSAMDELWVASPFLETVFGADFRGRVHHLPFPLPHAPAAVPDDAPKRIFTFGFVYDGYSSTERKNPVGAIRAFQNAFPIGDNRVRLTIKTRLLDHFPGEGDPVHEAAEGDDRITIVDEHWSIEQVHDFIAGLDAYVSLHRAEGLGMTMGEAMSAGVPVIATRYSGNLAYMNDANAWLVQATVVPIPAGAYHNNPEGSCWAEPNVKYAAALMRQVFDGGPRVEARRQQAIQDMQQYTVEATHEAFRDAVVAALANRNATGRRPVPAAMRRRLSMWSLVPPPWRHAVIPRVRQWGRERPYVRRIYHYAKRWGLR